MNWSPSPSIRQNTWTRVFLVSVVAVCSFLSGCHRVPREMTVADVATVRNAVIESLKSFETAERERDVDALLARIAPDFYMYQDGRRVDYASVVEQMKSTVPNLKRFEPSFENIEVIVLDRDTALVSMVFRDVITDANDITTRMWGPTTFLWKQIDDHWKMVYADSDHYPTVDPQTTNGK